MVVYFFSNHGTSRFTSYDFKKMQRRSYYPHNQHLISTATATSSSGLASSRPVTPANELRSDNVAISQGGGGDYHEDSRGGEKDVIHMEQMNSEKYHHHNS